MKNILMISYNSLRRKKVNEVILVFLIALAVLLMYISFSSFVYVDKMSEEKINQANSSNALLSTQRGYEDQMETILNEVPGLDFYEIEDCLFAGTASIINKKNSSKKETMLLMFMNYENARTMDKINILFPTGEYDDRAIILPYYLYAAKDYRPGDEIVIETSNGDYSYHIYGFTEDIFFDNPSNISIYKLVLSKGAYDKLDKVAQGEDSLLLSQTIYHIRLKDDVDAPKYIYSASKLISSDAKSQFFADDVSMVTGGSFFITIIMAIVLFFAAIIVVVSLVVIRFTINSNIENNIKNLGALSSIGYSSTQLRLATLIEFGGIAFVGGILGLVCNGFVKYFIATIVSSACGMVWNCPFSFGFALLSFLLMFTFVILITYLSSHRYKVITPLVALRNGIETHNYKKNHLELGKAYFSRNISLGIKALLSNMKQNIAILIIVCLLTMICLSMFVVYDNFRTINGPIRDVIGIEIPNCDAVIVQEEKYGLHNELLLNLENNPDIEEINKYISNSCTLISKDSDMTVSVNAFEDTSKLRTHTVYEGREPVAKNEIVITSLVAKNLNVGLGDIISVSNGIVKKDYYICGLGQQMTSLGKGARMSFLGYQELEPELKCSNFFIYLKNGVGTDDFIARNKGSMLEYGVELYNYDATCDVSLGSIKDSVKTLTTVLIIIASVIVVLITILIIKMKLLREKKNIGIYKALGYTSTDLIVQNLISSVPIVILGSVLGTILSYTITNPTFAFFLKTTGIISVNLHLGGFIFLGGILIVSLTSLIIALLCSLRITKIEPYKMIVEI